MRPKIYIPKEQLGRLYLKEGLSPGKIAAKFGCTSITVRNRLIEAGIPLKTKSAAQNRYAKHDFTGSDTEKAYMLGFRYGDLNAYQPKGASETIVVRSHTTHRAQEELFIKLFSRYGRITTSRNSRSSHMNCYLNVSFTFLLGKYPRAMRAWILSGATISWAFAAGYVDAEGTFGLNQSKGRFKIDAYDQEILEDLHALFIRSGIRSKLRVIARKGENDYGWVWKRDVWRLSVNEARSLELLIGRLDPYLLHKKRIADSKIVSLNICERRKNGTIK